jgi:ABC-type glycerol-3-phosphate transport system substrate-binding protein
MFHRLVRPRHGAWVILALLISLVPALHAQAPTILTIGVPDFIRGIAEETIVKPFEAENPDIDVQIVSVQNTPSYDGGDMNEYLDSVAKYVAISDLLLFTESSLVPEATRAGYLIDLMPFVRSDPDMNPDDFYPQMWNAFQWEGGMWAFPVAGDLIAMLYDPAKFDEAGLTYPDAFWTMEDFENAVRALSEVDDATGAITSTAVQVLDGRSPVILSLFNQPLYDPTNPDALPALTDPALETLVQQWYDLNADGLFATTEGEFSLDQAMLVSQTLLANIPALGGAKRELAPLPGGRTILSINGIGISAGTQHPDEAYRFIKFVSNSAQAATAFISALPARRSLVGAEVDTTNNPIAQFIPTASPEFIAQLETLLESAYTPGEIFYATHIARAIGEMGTQSIDAQTALSDEEANIVTARATAAERIGNVTVSVAEPETETVVEEGKVALKFGVVGFFGGLPNQEEWDAAIADFVATDPQVAAVDIEVANALTSGGVEDYVESYDCFYQNGNIVPSVDLTLLAPLDAYIASDPSYNPDDVVEGAINQLRREGQLWALPMSIAPAAMWYNEDKFAEAGAFTPYEGWTIGDFETALTALKDVMEEEMPPFVPRDPADGSYMLALVAAYGGLPIDFSQTPMKIDFANPAVVEASRQALNLVHDGYIKYSPLGNLGSTSIFLGGADDVYALYSQTIGGFLNFGGLQGDAENPVQYNLVGFPQGQEYVPVSYNVTSGYISGQSVNADACYRFMSSLMQRPALFGGMPVLRSLLDSDEIVSSLGESAVEFYRGIDAAMTDPKAVSLGGISGTGAGGETLAVIWLFRAWDKYAADDSVDLEKELQDADLFAKAYLECFAQGQADGTITANAGPLEGFRQWRECAVKVDPSMDSALPNF